MLIHQNLLKKVDLADLNSDVDKLDIEKLKIIPTNLSNLESRVDKLDVDKLVPFPVNLSKVRNVVKSDVVKKDVYNGKIENIEDKIPDITYLATNTTLITKRNEVKNEIPSITNLATTIAHNAKRNEVKNKIPNITNLATATAPTPVENKIRNVNKLLKKLTVTQKLLKFK